MGSDLALTLGVILGVCAIPSGLSALIDRRAPALAGLIIAAAAGLVTWAMTQHPGGYEIRQIPDAMLRVIAWLLH